MGVGTAKCLEALHVQQISGTIVILGMGEGPAVEIEAAAREGVGRT